MASRDEVFEAINSERDYQDARWGGPNDHPHSLTEYLVYMRDYLEEALHLLSRVSATEALLPTLHSVRKITALGVVAMEQHGAPKR